MTKTHIIYLICAGFLCAAFLFLLIQSTVGQEGGASKNKSCVAEYAGSGIKALVVQLEGKITEVEDVQLWKEKFGLMSLTKVPVDTYAVKLGRAELNVSFTKIHKIQFKGDKVLITSTDGRTMEGEVNKQERSFLKGKLVLGEFEIELEHVRKIELTHPSNRKMLCPSCRRLYSREYIRFCCYDGAKLKPAD